MTGTRFFLLNAIGGIAVLGCYAWGLGLFPELRDAMWGGVPENWRGLYTVNMFFVAVGGLWVWYALFRHTTQAPWFRALAALFFSFFVLQTALLDGVIWPLNFVRP